MTLPTNWDDGQDVDASFLNELDEAVNADTEGLDDATATPTSEELAEWDANLNLSANNFMPGFATTATSGTTTSLTIASAYVQVFTGNDPQTVKLPNGSVTTGYSVLIINQSSSPLAVETSGSAPVVTLAGGQSAVFFALTAAPTTALEWFMTPWGSASTAVDAEQFITLTSAYTLTSQTAVQQMFNSPTGGAVSLPVGTYFFECAFTLSSMSSSSGAFGFGLGGTAVITGASGDGVSWYSTANKATLATEAAPQSTVNTTAANAAICAATTATVGWAKITGKIRISAGGTLIPQVSLGVAAAALVGVDSYFRIWQVGSNTATYVGNWS